MTDTASTTVATPTTTTPAVAPVAPAAPTTPANPGGMIGAAAAAVASAEAPPTDVSQASPEAVASARLELSKLAPDAQVVMVIDGQEVVTTAQDAVRRLQRDVAADKRFAEAKRLRAEADAMRQRLVESLRNPEAFRYELAALGLDPSQFTDALTQAEIAERTMTPEQRELRELKRKQAEWEAQQQAHQQAIVRQQAAQAAQAYEAKFHEIMDSAGLPKSPVIRRDVMPILAAKVHEAMEVGGKVGVDALAKIARQFFDERASAIREAIDPEEVIGRVPVDRLRARLAELEAQAGQQTAAPMPKPVIPGVQPSEVPRDDKGRFVEREKPTIYRSGNLSSFNRSLR